LSANLTIRSITDREIDDIQQQSLILDVLVDGEVDENMYEGEDEEVVEALRQWTPELVDRQRYDLEGAFISMHYLFTGEQEAPGTTYPLNFLLKPKHPAGETGFGPASAFRPSEVREISNALNSLDPADLRIRYDADTFNKLKIYPRGYTWKPEDENSLIERFDEVKVFVAQVAAVGHGMILTIM
jgi:hypothetical protein